MRLIKTFFFYLVCAAVTLIPSTLTFACSVCFGGADSNLTRGFTWGISILLVLPFALMSGLALLIMTHMKKRAALTPPDEPHV